MIETLQQLDNSLLLMLNGLHTPFLDSFMYAYSGKAIWIPMYVMLAIAMNLRFGWKAGLTFCAFAGLTIALADQGCASWIRPYVARLRPSNPDNPISPLVHIVNGYRSGSYGFPSCHAANTVALATFAGLTIRLTALPMFIWAFLQCYSRAYLGVHYPGDLLVGAIIGILAGWLMATLARKTANRLTEVKPHEHRSLYTVCGKRIAVEHLPLIAWLLTVMAIVFVSL